MANVRKRPKKYQSDSTKFTLVIIISQKLAGYLINVIHPLFNYLIIKLQLSYHILLISCFV